MGDPCGIGPEVIAKAASQMSRIRHAAFFIFGDKGLLSGCGLKGARNIFLADIKNGSGEVFEPGVPSLAGARASLRYLDAAVAFIKRKCAGALVTGPISKEGVRKCGFRWQGHTEFLADAFGVKRVEMVFVSERMKVVLLTRHLSLKKAIKALSREHIYDCGRLMFDLLKNNFKIPGPRIAVCGLNPHAGESGLFGDEEDLIIRPAIKKLGRKYRGCFFGPYPADTVFYNVSKGGFDLVMAMYHDQGLIPFKLLSFDSGVNLTAGLPIIRTSPVHGTAFDIAGKHKACPGSMIAALRLAAGLAANGRR
ncbi:MAG TPA: 4-hydroxythreonine-4-phosphate dehydrogenase PdxA [Candidatus Omnitrophica bacterium]|nr:4-hydroxythreonine-4-phosphate dehydrogenase PdxA [Candidatus Omnitrophota bacterium]